MKTRNFIPTLLFGICMLFAVSCEDVTSYQTYAEERFRKDFSINDERNVVIYCELSKSKSDNSYNGTIYLSGSDLVEIPVSVAKHDGEMEMVYKVSRNKAEELVKQATSGIGGGYSSASSAPSIDNHTWLIGKWKGTTNYGIYSNSYRFYYIDKNGYFESRHSGTSSSGGKVRINFIQNDLIQMGIAKFRLDSNQEVFYLLSDDGELKEKYVKVGNDESSLF